MKTMTTEDMVYVIRCVVGASVLIFGIWSLGSTFGEARFRHSQIKD